MSDKVIVVLDRGTADYLRLVGIDEDSPEFFSDCYQHKVMPAVRAALDRDPDELVEQVAEAMYGAARSEWNQAGVNYATGPEWDRLTDWQRKVYLDMARAVIAALTEDARTGGGEGNG